MAELQSLSVLGQVEELQPDTHAELVPLSSCDSLMLRRANQWLQHSEEICLALECAIRNVIGDFMEVHPESDAHSSEFTDVSHVPALPVPPAEIQRLILNGLAQENGFHAVDAIILECRELCDCAVASMLQALES